MPESTYQRDNQLNPFSSLKTYTTYNWINNHQFYSIVPAQYRNYYFHFVRRYFYWYDGFVPYFHTQSSGIVSTKIAKAIIHKLATLVIGNKLMYDREVETDKTIEYYGKKVNSIEFVEAWAKKNTFVGKLRLLEEWCEVAGDSAIKLDNNAGELVPSIARKDQYFFDTDFKGKMSRFQSLIYTFHTMTTGSNNENRVYYLVEEREYDEQGKPQYRMSMKEGAGSFGLNRDVDFTPETIPYKSLPRNVRHEFSKAFPDMLLGEWQELPFDNLGVFLLKASEKVSFLPTLPFGESKLNTIIHLLQTYDFYYSSQLTNIYTARDKVILPEHMQTPNDNQSHPAYDNFNTGFDNFIYSKQRYMNNEDQKPISIQFNLRAEDWSRTRDNLIQQMAMQLNVSVRTLLEAAVPNSEKPTAREIGSDEYATTSFVEERHTYAKGVVDDLLETLLKFYDFEDVIDSKFSKAGLTNLNNVTTIITQLKQNEIIDTRMALEMFFTDKSEKQIDELTKRVKEEIKERKEQEQAQQVEREEQQDNDLEKKIVANETKDLNQTEKKKGLIGKIFNK